MTTHWRTKRSTELHPRVIVSWLWDFSTFDWLPAPTYKRQSVSARRNPGYVRMKAAFMIFISAVLFCGCSQKHTAYVDQSVEIVAGKDVVMGDYVVSVKKRDSNFLEGVRIVRRESDGKETTVTADTGTMIQGPKQGVEAQPTDTKTQDRLRVVEIHNSVTITLSNALVQTKTPSGTTKMTVQNLEMRF